MSWTLTQSIGATNSASSGNIAATLTGVTVGHLLVANFSNFNHYLSGGCGDTVNSWFQRGENFFTGDLYTELWYSIVTTGGSLTVTGTGQAFGGMALIEFNPGGGTITTDGSAPTATGTSTAPSSGNITITTPDLVIGGFGSSGGSGITWSTSGAYTYDSTSGSIYVGSSHYGAAIGYNLTAGSSPANPALTLSSSSKWIAVGAAFFATTPSGSLFRQPAMSGMGGGGPFFGDPLGRM